MFIVLPCVLAVFEHTMFFVFYRLPFWTPTVLSEFWYIDQHFPHIGEVLDTENSIQLPLKLDDFMAIRGECNRINFTCNE